MVRKMWLQQKYYDFVANESKVFEGQLGTGKNRDLKIGDSIVFNNLLKVKVTSIHIFSSYEDVMKVSDFKKLIPDAESINEAINIHEEFYFKKKQAKFGVWIFGIELV